MKDTPLAPWLRSSMDPTVVSNTIKGVGTTLSGVILLLLALLAHPASPGDVASVFDQIATIGGQLASGLGAAWTFYGLFMKGVMWLHGSVSPTSA